MTLQQTNSYHTSVQGTDLSTRHVSNGNRLLAFQEFILPGYTPECWINCHEQRRVCDRAVVAFSARGCPSDPDRRCSWTAEPS
jgi:hypothetical protein